MAITNTDTDTDTNTAVTGSFSATDSASNSDLVQLESVTNEQRKEQQPDISSSAAPISGRDRARTQPPVKSRYHISTQYAQQQQLLQQEAGNDNEQGDAAGTPSSSSSSLIGKRARDPASECSTQLFTSCLLEYACVSCYGFMWHSFV